MTVTFSRGGLKHLSFMLRPRSGPRRPVTTAFFQRYVRAYRAMTAIFHLADFRTQAILHSEAPAFHQHRKPVGNGVANFSAISPGKKADLRRPARAGNNNNSVHILGGIRASIAFAAPIQVLPHPARRFEISCLPIVDGIQITPSLIARALIGVYHGCPAPCLLLLRHSFAQSDVPILLRCLAA